ncbi:MAG: AcrR family transcriptional regulator [Myxococcota bacterium]
MSSEDLEDGLPKPPRIPTERPGKPGGKRDENRRRKVRQLCDAGLGLMLGLGVEAVTVEQIAKNAGVAKGSFYRYFEDKEELVGALIEPLGHGIRGAFDACDEAIGTDNNDGPIDATYGQLAGALEEVLLAFPREILLYLQECRGPRVGARIPIRRLADVVSGRSIDLTRAAQQRRVLREFPPKISALTVVGAAERLLFEVLSGGNVGAPREAAEQLIALVMDGLRGTV